MSEQLQIREYQPKDHQDVRRIFDYAIREPFWNREAFKQCLKCPKVQFNLVLLCLSGLLISYFHGLAMLTIGLCIHGVCIYSCYDSYARTHLATDMADDQLKFWTTPPNVFLVALTSGKVVGFVSYREINPTTVEMHRLNVDKYYRGLGIASRLVQALRKIAKQNGYEVMYLETTSSQTNAIKFYQKTFQFLRNVDFEHPFYKHVSGLHSVAFISLL